MQGQIRLWVRRRKKEALHREGATVYNTAVLIDRHGEVAGKYRKVYLPREEVERGLTPGTHFPVFQTDFGKTV